MKLEFSKVLATQSSKKITAFLLQYPQTILFKKAKKTDDKLIFLAKLNEDKFRRSSMYRELENYVGQSDYWQQHQFKLKTAH